MHCVKMTIAVLGALLLLSFVVAAADEPATSAKASETPTFSGPFNWVSTGPIISARGDAQHPLNAIKDPTIVRHDGKWHLFASSVTKTGDYSMVYLSFADWKDAGKATQFPLDSNRNLRGYHCAPQVFYFAPHKLWYLIYQSQHPTYSTTSDLSKPESWSEPKSFFAEPPKSVVEGWLDYWVICDDSHAYLFFSDDHGRFYRSGTALADFPNGFDEPVVAMQEKEPRDLYEASCVYRIKGTNQYLALIEAANGQWKRYYKAFIADRLDGTWRPLAAEWGKSFADTTRIRTEDGATLWTNDISHGELVRDGNDQSMMIDPSSLTFLYQGLPHDQPPVQHYNLLPWQLGLLRRDTITRRAQEKMTPVDAWTAVGQMTPGINIGNTLEATGQWETGWGNPPITKEYVQTLARLGFKSVRLPVAWDTYADNGRITAKQFQRVAEVVDWITEAGMYCVLNVHWDGGWIDSDVKEKFPDTFRTFSPEAEKKFRSYWAQISRFFASKNEKLIFEALNEQTEFDNEPKPYETLTRVNQLFIDTVRHTGGNNADRLLMVPGYNTDIDKTCRAEYKLPKDTVPGKFFLSIHYYTPWDFVGLNEDASWGKMRTTWGSDVDLKQLNQLFDRLSEFSKRIDTPVYIGEFSMCSGKGESGVRWTNSVYNAALKRKMVPVLWDTGGAISRREPYAPTRELIEMLRKPE